MNESVYFSGKKVAICQSGIIFGGRLHVLLEIVRVLNKMGIKPDILTSKLMVDPKKIQKQYGDSFQFQVRIIPFPLKRLGELSIVLFNASLTRYVDNYDLVINSSNSLMFLPKKKKFITYMHFPRERRVAAKEANLHLPHNHSSLLKNIERHFMRNIYRFRRIHSGHYIVCNSEFTKNALQQEYSLYDTPDIIYPPVDLAKFKGTTQQRNIMMISVGRFSPNKRQMEQIMLAEKMTNISFCIVGFSGNDGYYRKCENYVAEKRLSNVSLKPNVPFDRMVKMLQRSKFFLHSLINEPFGITTVQAIAAGCLPIVHDSGGQREIVIDEILRYKDLDEVGEKIELLKDPVVSDKLYHRLWEHIQKFDVQEFHDRMRMYIIRHLQ